MKNKWMKAFAILLVFLGTTPIASASTKYVLVQSELNVRARASLGSSIYGRLYTGDVVEVERTYRDWSYLTGIPSEEGYGWVSSHYLVDSEVTEMDGAIATIIGNGRVAVRECVDGKRKCWVHPGDEVKIYGTSETWCVTDKGYIKTEYILVKE